VYVVWVDNNSIYFRSSQENGTKFSNPIVLSSDTTLSSSPQIAATEKGDVYVVWVDRNNATGRSNIVFRSSNDSGKDFAPSIRLNRNSNDNQTSNMSSPQIAATEKGDVYVVWVDEKASNGDRNIAFTNSNNSGKDFGSRKFLRANDLLSYSPQIAATETGDVYVVWVDANSSTGESNIIFRSSNDSGKDFDRSVRLNRNPNPNQTSVSSSPQLAATESGAVYVVWIDKNNATGDSNVVFRSSNDSGMDFDHSIRLNRYPNQTSISSSPQIAATESGSAYVIWIEKNVEFKEILQIGSIYGRTISLNNNPVLQLSPQLVATEKGNGYLIWSEKSSDTKNNTALIFKRFSQSYFDRNS